MIEMHDKSIISFSRNDTHAKNYVHNARLEYGPTRPLLHAT